MPRRGPRTPGGRARSSRNATRHGLYSRDPIAGETLDAWQAFHDGALASLGARGAIETVLAGRIAALLWRLRRVPVAEAKLAARAAARDAGALPIPDLASLAIIARHEATLVRKLRRSLHHLAAHQDARRAHPAPLELLDRLREEHEK